MNTRIFVQLCLIAVALQSCIFQSTEIISNQDIDSGLRETIKDKNDSLMEALTGGKRSMLEALGSKSFKENLGARVNKVSQTFHSTYFYKGEYTVFDEYQSDSSANDTIAISSEQHGYTLRYANEAEETYVSLLKIRRSEKNFLFTAIYGKENGEWKLSEIRMDLIGLHGKTAQDFYELAKKKEKRGFLFDASNYADLAAMYKNATEGFIIFKDSENMEPYKEKLAEMLRKKDNFPKVLENIGTKPSVIGRVAVQGETGMINRIDYVTRIPIADTKGRHEEFKLVTREAREEFKDMDFDKYETDYRVYSTSDPNTMLPDGRSYYDMSDVNYDLSKNID